MSLTHYPWFIHVVQVPVFSPNNVGIIEKRELTSYRMFDVKKHEHFPTCVFNTPKTPLHMSMF